ncbi:hypothetical protein [Oceanivirga salmonicida]|uniref:hypothetical protein n=1 Tax=Oceanivirga salmonicida TaxID=1769291 RepID=UPI00082C6C1E|nr:hypothetical protein [Oceanivirga salmonicida]
MDEIGKRLKLGQTMHHVLSSLREEGYAIVSETTVYSWINKGYIRYNKKKIKRKKKEIDKKETIQYLSRKEILKNKEYEDFLKYMKENPKANIVEMDLVCGRKGTNGYIMTLFIPSIQFLLGYKIQYKTPQELIYFTVKQENQIKKQE